MLIHTGIVDIYRVKDLNCTEFREEAMLAPSHLADDWAAADSFPVDLHTVSQMLVITAGVNFYICMLFAVFNLNIIPPAYRDKSATASFTGGCLGDNNLINDVLETNSFLDNFPDLVTVCTVVKIAYIKGKKFACLIALCVVVNILVITYTWLVGVVRIRTLIIVA